MLHPRRIEHHDPRVTPASHRPRRRRSLGMLRCSHAGPKFHDSDLDCLAKFESNKRSKIAGEVGYQGTIMHALARADVTNKAIGIAIDQPYVLTQSGYKPR